MLVHVEVGILLLERAYAKINLTLDVLGKRHDGYHEVDMVMQSIDLSDLVWLEGRSDSAIVLESTAAHIPTDDRNLAVQAAMKFREHTGIQTGVHINLEKNIPVAAGLAGGSSDAAAVLRGLNRLFRTHLSLATLAELGAQIGSDVPFCVYGGTAIARGRGEHLTRFTHPSAMYVLLIYPRMFVSTAEIYGGLRPENYAQTPQSARMREALLTESVDMIPGLITNDLQPVTFHLYPEVEQIARKVETVIRHPVHMSGSGPTLFSLVPTLGQLNRMYNALRGVMRDVHISRFVLNTSIPGHR